MDDDDCDTDLIRSTSRIRLSFLYISLKWDWQYSIWRASSPSSLTSEEFKLLLAGRVRLPVCFYSCAGSCTSLMSIWSSEFCWGVVDGRTATVLASASRASYNKLISTTDYVQSDPAINFLLALDLWRTAIYVSDSVWFGMLNSWFAASDIY